MNHRQLDGGACRCPFCGGGLSVVQVHGHGQCGRCGTNLAPCCGGASADAEVDEPGPRATQIDPMVFVRLFGQLGGTDRTVTKACAVQALARALDTALDDAQIVIDAGLALGHIVATADTLRLAVPPPAAPAAGERARPARPAP